MIEEHEDSISDEELIKASMEEDRFDDRELSPETSNELVQWQDDPASKKEQPILNKDLTYGNISEIEMKRAEGYALMCKIAEQEGWEKTFQFFHFKLYGMVNLSTSVNGFGRKVRQTKIHDISRRSMTKMEMEKERTKKLFGIVNV